MFERDIIESRVFANGSGDLCSIPGRVIPKTFKMVLNTSLLSTHQYKVRIKGKVEQFRKGVAPSPTPRCSSYWKGSLLVALDCSRQLLLQLLWYKIILQGFLNHKRRKKWIQWSDFKSCTRLFAFTHHVDPIYPTPPLGKDMTQGHFLSGV